MQFQFPQFFKYLFMVALLTVAMSTDSSTRAAEKIVRGLIERVQKLPPHALDSLKEHFSLMERITTSLNQLTPNQNALLQKDIDRLFSLLLDHILASTKLQELDKIDRIKDLTVNTATSELYAHKTLAAVLTMFRADTTMSSYDLLVSGILGSIGRNPHLSDNFLREMQKLILEGIETMKQEADRDKEQRAAIAFQKFRNLKSLGKNEQASGNFLASLTNSLLRLPLGRDHEHILVPGIRDYILTNKNTPRETLEQLIPVITTAQVPKIIRDGALKEIAAHPNATEKIRRVVRDLST